MKAAGSTLTVGELLEVWDAGRSDPEREPVFVELEDGTEVPVTEVELTSTGLVLHAGGSGDLTEDVLRSVLDELEKRARYVGRRGEPAAWVRDFLLDMAEEYDL